MYYEPNHGKNYELFQLAGICLCSSLISNLLQSEVNPNGVIEELWTLNIQMMALSLIISYNIIKGLFKTKTVSLVRSELWPLNHRSTLWKSITEWRKEIKVRRQDNDGHLPGLPLSLFSLMPEHVEMWKDSP